MKKIIALVIAVLSLSLVLTAACAQTVAIVQPMSHTSLDQIRETIVARLTADGYTVVTGNDNTIASAMALYTDTAYAAGIPVYCGADSMVADGGFATIGVNYVQLGDQVAALAEQILSGAAPSALPYETLSEYAKFVNLQAADRFGADFPESAYEGYSVLVEADGTSHF